MLTNGFNHAAILTSDTARWVAFYHAAFGAVVRLTSHHAGGIVTVVQIGDDATITLFEIEGNEEAQRQRPMFQRGRIDHIALSVPDRASFEEVRSRLRSLGASDDVVTDFGAFESVYATDPDGMELEVCFAAPGRTVADVSEPTSLRDRALA